MEDLNKFYASFWKQSSSALSGLHSVHEHKLMTLGSRHNQTQGVSINSNKRKSLPGFVDLNSDVRTSIRRKSDAYHGVIDLEKPSISGDAVEAIGCSGFGNLADQNGKSQDGSCCISPENTSVAESLQFCRDWNASRVSVGSVGSSDTPDCQSPIKTSNTEARHSLFDLNVPQEESFLMPPTVFPSSSTHRGKFSDNHREASGKECVSGSGIGSMKGSSITVITPNSVPDNSRDVITESSVQQKFLFDLNVSPECTDMPSEISDYRDKVVNNDVSNGTAPDHSFSTKNSLHAETSAKHVVLGNDHMLAHKDDSDLLLTAPTTIIKVQWPESGTINKELFIPGSPLVDNNFHSRLGLSHSGTLNIQELSMLQDKVDDDGTTVDIAARTLLSIFQRRSECIDHRFGSSNKTAAAQNGDDEPQPSLDSFENIVLNLEEIKDDGQSINVPTPYNEGPACRIKLKRGRGMRNFHREIIPGLLLGKQEICDDLEVIGYEPKKTRSRKTRKGPGASSSRPRPRKRGAVKH